MKDLTTSPLGPSGCIQADPCRPGGALSLWHGYVSSERARMPTIAAEIAAMHGVTVADQIGPSRIATIARARHHAMWRMYQEPHLSLTMIGRYLGGRDHTTVLYGIRRHQLRIDLQVASEAA